MERSGPVYERPFPPQQPSPYPPQQPSPQGPPSPYPNPPHPYGQQPYQGQQHPYQGPQQPPQGPAHPYSPQSAPHSPYAPPAAAPRIPNETNLLRRLGGIFLDGLLALTAAYVALRSANHAGLPALQTFYTVAGAGFGLSFLNHVLLTRVAGASLGKFAVRTRVIRETDATRPRLPRLFRRWLGGYFFLVIWIIASCFDLEDDPEDFCGLRLVSYRDLRAATGAPLR